MRIFFKKNLYNLIPIYFFLSVIILIFYLILKIFSGSSIINLIILSILVIINISYFFLNHENKKNFFLIYFSSVLSIYVLNFLLIILLTDTNDIYNKKKLDIDWDTRTKIQFINDMKKINDENIFRHYSGSNIIRSGFFNNIDKININKLHPFSNISLSTIVHCNEYGVWKNFYTDKLGFNNPKHYNFDDKKISVSILGDSFTEGFCHNNGEDIGSLIRKKNLNVMNFGKASGGLHFYEAIYREYIKNNKIINTDFVVMNIFFTNDVLDTNEERNSEFFKKYINDENYSQNLFENNEEVQNLLKFFYKAINKNNILEKHPELSFLLENKNYDVEKNLIMDFIKLKELRYLIFSNLNIRLQPKMVDMFYADLDKIINRITKKHKLIIVYLPSYDELFYKINRHSDKMFNFVQNKKNGNLMFINMYNKYKEHEIDTLFPLGIPGHYSINGYEILANEIIKIIN